MFPRTMISALLLTIALFVLAACGGAPASAPAESAPEATEAPAEEAATEPASEATEVPAEEPAAEADSSATAASTGEGMRTFVVVPDQSTASYLVDEEFFGGALDKLGITPANTMSSAAPRK